MNNYEYIIASLPSLTSREELGEDFSPAKFIDWIRSQCSSRDNELIDLLLDGFDETKLNKEFYEKALNCRNPFIRDYFNFDLAVRNAKVRFLNRALDRKEHKNIFLEENCDQATKSMIAKVFTAGDLLEREKKIDTLYYRHIGEITLFNYFDINVILAFIAKLMFIDRWLKLDQEKGKKVFRKLVKGVRGTYKGIEYKEQ